MPLTLPEKVKSIFNIFRYKFFSTLIFCLNYHSIIGNPIQIVQFKDGSLVSQRYLSTHSFPIFKIIAAVYKIYDRFAAEATTARFLLTLASPIFACINVLNKLRPHSTAKPAKAPAAMAAIIIMITSFVVVRLFLKKNSPIKKSMINIPTKKPGFIY